jgi:hypothetical protein
MQVQISDFSVDITSNGAFTQESEEDGAKNVRPTLLEAKTERWWSEIFGKKKSCRTAHAGNFW